MKCIWCNKPCDAEYQIKIGNDEKTHFCCSQGCQSKAEKFLRFEKRFTVLFLVLLCAPVVALIFGSTVNPKVFCSIPFSAMGIAVLIFPFCTPETVQLFGLKKSILIGRSLGVLIIALGILFYFHL